MKSFFPLIALSVLLTSLSCKSPQNTENAVAESADTTSVCFQPDSAFALIVAQCDMGPRVPGSTAHARCARWIASQFEARGLVVETQQSRQTMWDGKQFDCLNIFARFKPEAERRILLCSHWDSRPWADQDADSTKHRQPVLAANDGASGVAVMLEIARLIGELNPAVGVDFLCFDLEDYGAPYWGNGTKDESDWCVGSRYWARQKEADYKPAYAILLDMVGGNGTQFLYEYFSRTYAQSVLARTWAAASTAGVGAYFPQKDGLMLTDDHLPLNRIAHIPTIDIIGTRTDGFCPTWHTTDDTPENISPALLKAVGQTLLQLLYEEK
ncbi:MAG: M28 family peptidase [Alloprevotella sp.]|nr:M28 family peptidase [Alloprevotella sp.]